MAAKHFYRQGFLLLLFNFIPSAALNKRFSNFKRCADEECSMLLCRGKAVKDFSGPDCRFLSFKKSETIYVYYKLAGIREDIWAGSVGSSFGYFPKDLLAVNHLYTDKEFDVPAEETDFVCFDSGFDKFDNYDIDLLLGSSVEGNDSENKGKSDKIQVSEDTPKETHPSSIQEQPESGNPPEADDKPEDLGKVPDNPSSSLHTPVTTTEPPRTKVTETAEVVLENVSESSSTKDTPTKSEVESVPVSVSEGVKIPEFKTTLGTTFDAVTTDEEITKKVTPYEEEESREVESHPEGGDDVREETLLLSFSKESVNTPASDTIKLQDIPTATPNEKPEAAEEKNMWTSIGDAVFSAVTGVETTAHDVSSEDDDDYDDEDEEEGEEEEAVAKPLSTFEESREHGEETLNTDPLKVPESIDEVLQDSPEPSIMQADDKDLVSDSEDESDGEVIEHANDLDEMLEPTVESDNHTESNAVTVQPVPQDHISAKPEVEKSDSKITYEPSTEDEVVIKDSEVSEDMADTQDSRPVVKTVTGQEPDTESETDLGSEKVQFNDLVKQEEKMVDSSLPSQTHDTLLKEEENIVDASLPHQIHDALLKEEEKTVDASLPSQTHVPLVKDEENIVDASLPNQIHVPLVKDEENIVDASLPSQTHDTLVKAGEEVADASLPHPINDSSPEHIEKIQDASLPDDIHNTVKTNLEHNIQQELYEEPEIHYEVDTEEKEDDDDDVIEEEGNRNEEKEPLLEDENALLFFQSDKTHSDKPSPDPESLSSELTPEPEYSDSIIRLTLLREHFMEEQMHRFQKLLGLKNLIKVEAMFSDLDTELQATRLSHAGTTTQDIENALENILESSENTILDEIEKMLDSQELKDSYVHQTNTSGVDEETQILDDFQELAFSLRHKYSPFSDSAPLATENTADFDQDEPEIIVRDIPHVVEEDKVANIPENENKSADSVTVTDFEERPANTEEEQVALDKVHTGPDISVEEDGGHFNKNKDNQPGFSESDEMQMVPQATLENPLDLGFGVEVENSPSGSLDSMEPVSEVHEEDVGAFSTGAAVMSGFFRMCKRKIEEWTIIMISLLPEEWKPGETFFGCPWQAVVTTALVGIMTFTLFFWRTVLAIKKREYLVDERKLTEQIQALKKEKNSVEEKMSELQKQAERLKENQEQSKEAVSSTKKKIVDLESKVLEAETRNERMVEEKNTYIKLLEEERANSLQNQTRIDKLEKANEKLQLSRKKIQEAFAKTTVLLDEAKIREDARNVHQKSLEKDYTALKEENKMLKATIKNWEDKHLELSEQIKVYHKSQKDLEDSLVLKDHNVEVLSELLADLDACDLQKGDNKVLANGEVAPDKKTAIKNRIKQMMDVSRVQTTLTVVEDERDRFMAKLLNEEKARKTLEEQHQELEHSIATLKSERSHVENQLKILQQKNEIMVEMYQQKENALQQRLTKEELERRSKENLLSEVGGKAHEAEEQVKVLRHRINEMEEQMKKTEEVYKEQIKEQENKTHSNWVNARNAERALNQEKLESSKLREKLAVLTSQLNDRRAPLFRPNSGQPSGPRQGDSYGPSPVSGGAPSPPIMIEGPRRPPSAPVGRRIDPYGPRPPSDPHGRYADSKHISGMDMMGPRSSSPANMDVSTQAVNPQIKAEAQAEASTESPEPGPGSFLASPIRDSPGPMVQGPLPGSGPHDPHGRLPPPGLYRPPRPGLYHLPPGPHGSATIVPPPLHGPPLPANGQPGMPLPGPMGGDFGPRPANGHTFLPRPGPGLIPDLRGPPPQHFRPPLPSHFLPPTGIRGPVGPRQHVPLDMRFPGAHDHNSPPMDIPPGAPPHLADASGRAPPSALHNSVGAHSGPRQDLHMRQEAPQDSVKPAMVKP